MFVTFIKKKLQRKVASAYLSPYQIKSVFLSIVDTTENMHS